MEENVIQSAPAAEPALHVTNAGRYHVKGIATWLKIMAVLGTISMLFIIYLTIKLFQITPAAGIPYLIVVALYIYPLVKAFTASSQLKTAQAVNDSAALEKGLSDMRSLLTYLGVLAIIGMVFTVLGIIIIIASGEEFMDILIEGMTR